jgi:uncharacterized membrane protein (UPF0127 family)
MKVIKTKLRGRDFRLAVATTKKERKQGLSDTKKLKKDAGMLFVFKKPREVTMNMYKMNYPLDMVFTDSNWNVVEYKRMHPGEDIYVDSKVKYVIEVNAGSLSALPIGLDLNPDEEFIEFVNDVDAEADEDTEEVKEVEQPKAKEESAKNIIIKLTDDEVDKHPVFKRGGKIQPKEKGLKINPHAMQVLDDTGVVLMNITGGERIFSRKHTEQLIQLAKDVKKGKRSKKELGEAVKEILHIQDTQDPEYVYE